jgi:dihydroorotase
MKILIKNATMYEKSKAVQKDLFLEKGVIEKIDDKINRKADKEIDATGLVVLPGMIDLHVHCREPGDEHKEDFLTASQAAVAGGVTTFFDMPNNKEPTSTMDALGRKRKLAKKAVCNYGFNFGVVEIDEELRIREKIKEKYNISEVKEAVKEKCVKAVKVYLGETTGGLVINDLKVVEKALNVAKIVMLHVEDDLIEEVLKIFDEYNKKHGGGVLYICHVNSKKMVDIIKKYKKKLKDKLFCEVSPHHLYFTVNDKERLGPLFKVKPDILSTNDQKALWKALADGIIDVVATDHAPHTLQEKFGGEVPNGMPGLETALPVLLDAVNQNILKIGDVIRAYSENPAKIFGLKRRGKIKEGYHADLTLVQMNLKKSVINDTLLTKCKWSAFGNSELVGFPMYTIINGNLVYEYEKFTDGRKVHDIKGMEVD